MVEKQFSPADMALVRERHEAGNYCIYCKSAFCLAANGGSDTCVTPSETSDALLAAEAAYLAEKKAKETGK